jgi:chromosomal replication initiator protein
MEIVSAMHRALVGRVGKERHEVWFGRGVRMEPCGTTLRIAAADRFRLDYLRRVFRTDLAEAARLVAGTELALEFVLDPAIAANIIVQKCVEDATATLQEPQPVANDAIVRVATPVAAEQAKPVVIRAAVRLASQAGNADEQPPQRKAGRPFAALNDFLASEPNRLAQTAAITAATQPGKYSPLTIVGPPGAGKTHLLEGIWRKVRDTRLLTRVVYLSAEQFTNQFLDALRQAGTPLFRRKVRDVEMLLIDDVQFFANKQSTIVELVHTFDTLQRGGKQLVFAADRPPDEIKGLGPELITRLKGGLVCSLAPADFATRLGILRQLAARQGVQAPDDVLTWLAGQLSGDARHLAGAVHRLRAASEAHERGIDLEFAQAALDDLIHASKRPVRLPDIVEAVADVFGVPPDDLHSGGKSAGVTMPRMLVMFLARKWTRAALSEISRTLGRKSHSTVVSAQHKVTAWLADGKTVTLGRGQCRVEDAIKRIEGQLRLG